MCVCRCVYVCVFEIEERERGGGGCETVLKLGIDRWLRNGAALLVYFHSLVNSDGFSEARTGVNGYENVTDSQHSPTCFQNKKRNKKTALATARMGGGGGGERTKKGREYIFTLKGHR